MTDKTHSILKKVGVWSLSALVIMLIFKLIFPLLWPFIIAFLLALLLDPYIRNLELKFGLKRGFASAFCVTLLLFLLAGTACFIIAKLVTAAGDHLSSIPELPDSLSFPSPDISRALERIAANLPKGLESLLQNMFDSLHRQASALPARVYSEFFDILAAAVSKAPNIIFSVFMLTLGLYFISGGLPAIKSFLLRQLPQKLRSRTALFKKDVLGTLSAWAKAQLKLMGICFVELSAAFLLIRLNNALLIAAAIALVDALPVFGVGLVLIPWTGICLLSGNYRRALLLGLTYALINLVRSCLEPRLLGKQAGLHPAATLITVYAGYRISGVFGMIFFPITLMLLKQLNDRGWLKLWR